MIMIAPGIPKTWNEIVELILRAGCVVSIYSYVARLYNRSAHGRIGRDCMQFEKRDLR